MMCMPHRVGPSTGALRAFAVFPELPGLADRGLRDGVDGLYADMAARGELLIAGRRVADVGRLLEEALDRWGRPGVIVCDRWREAELRDALEAVGFPLTSLTVRGQGFRDGGEDVRIFRRACLSKRVKPERSLLLRAAMAEARVATDVSANAKLIITSSRRGRQPLARGHGHRAGRGASPATSVERISVQVRSPVGARAASSSKFSPERGGSLPQNLSGRRSAGPGRSSARPLP